MTETQLDRRSVLKKAAAGGAIVWTAPLITSSVASAQVATPKCAPNEPNVCASWIAGTEPGTATINCTLFQMNSMTGLARQFFEFCGCEAGPTCPNGPANSPLEVCLSIPNPVTLTSGSDVRSSGTPDPDTGFFQVADVAPAAAPQGRLWLSNSFRIAARCNTRSCGQIWGFRDFRLNVTISQNLAGACNTSVASVTLGGGTSSTQPCTSGVVLDNIADECAVGGTGIL